MISKYMDRRNSNQIAFYIIAVIIVIAAVFIVREMMRPAAVIAPDGGQTATSSVCNYDDPGKSYVKKEKNCVINFLCIRGRQAFSDECGCGCKAADGSGGAFLQYENKDFGFSFSYPERDKKNDNTGYQYVTANSLARVDLPAEDFRGTNLGEASFIVGASKDAKIIKNCLVRAPEESGTTTKAIINGTDFTVFNGADPAAGNLYETESYRAVKNGTCYEATLLLHSGNIYNYEPGTVKEFDREKALSGLREILDTLIIN